jgi:hypothetical protein
MVEAADHDATVAATLCEVWVDRSFAAIPNGSEEVAIEDHRHLGSRVACRSFEHLLTAVFTLRHGEDSRGR